ncbi:MAG: hypothetical protein ACO394_02285 [Blastocatellia bacterium]
MKLDVVGLDLRHLLDPLSVFHLVGQRVVWVGNADLRVKVIAMPATSSLKGGTPAGAAGGGVFSMLGVRTSLWVSRSLTEMKGCPASSGSFDTGPSSLGDNQGG